MKAIAVIPHWNRRDLLESLLPNLGSQTRPFEEVIVVDNGSRDGSAAYARDQGATVLELRENVGFAPAVNRGIERALADGAAWIAILNNDVTLEPDWLALLLAAASDDPDKQVHFVTGKILSARNPSILDGTWDEISRGGAPLRCGSGKPDGPYWNQRRRIRMTSMTAALFRAEIFHQIGTLDEDFTSYLEDVDFGLRCMKSGLGGVYEPAAVAYHLGSSTLGQWSLDAVRKLARNQILLEKKHFKGFPRLPIVVSQLLWGLLALRHGRFGAFRAGRREARHLASIGGEPATKKFQEEIRESEQTILAVQRTTGFDWFWRVYFWTLQP